MVGISYHLLCQMIYGSIALKDGYYYLSHNHNHPKIVSCRPFINKFSHHYLDRNMLAMDIDKTVKDLTEKIASVQDNSDASWTVVKRIEVSVSSAVVLVQVNPRTRWQNPYYNTIDHQTASS